MKTTAPIPLKKSDPLAGVDFSAGTALLVDKPAGWTSFDVVNRLRRSAQVKKVGHAGTLDPAATGLLIILTGAATQYQSQFMGLNKEYFATMLLGVETTTWDLEGEITSQRPVPELALEQVKLLLQDRFTGDLLQAPPAFSAIKQGGIPSYRQARQGKVIVHEPRPVTVQALEVTDWSPPEMTLNIQCSSGFYVRSLAHDLGQVLDCGGVLKSLIRTAIGPYRLEDAFSLDELLGKITACRN